MGKMGSVALMCGESKMEVLPCVFWLKKQIKQKDDIKAGSWDSTNISRN